MDYGIENTTHDKAYFDEIDKEDAKEVWLENRTAEIVGYIIAGDHNLYSVADCVTDNVYDSSSDAELEKFNSAMRIFLAENKPDALYSQIERAVIKQARMLAEGELAAMENEGE